MLDGVELSVCEAGVGGKPLLLIHGFTGAKEDFAGWLDPLADLGWHAVAPDHRGHGSSSKPTTEDSYSMAILARDVVGLSDALGWRSFALLGHSLGGYVAQRVASAVPSRLDALILMDTGHGPVEGLDQAQVEKAVLFVRQLGMDRLADAQAGRDSPLDTPAHRRVLAENPGYAEFNERKLRASSPSMYSALLPELADGDDHLAVLTNLEPKPPALVIVGEQDRPFLNPSRRIAEALGADVAIIPDAGHSPQFENPDVWWEVLSAFLSGLSR